MPFQHSREAPAPGLLAIEQSSPPLTRYGGEIADAQAYWRSERDRAGSIGSGALLSMSDGILGGLDRVTAYSQSKARRNPDSQDKFTAKRARQEVLSALGISMTLRAEWTSLSPVEPDFTGPNDEIGIILDMVSNRGRGDWIDFRIHTVLSPEYPLPEGTNEQWLKTEGLWIRQTQPAQPTDFLAKQQLPDLGIAVDFSQLQTIYPYVETK